MASPSKQPEESSDEIQWHRLGRRPRKSEIMEERSNEPPLFSQSDPLIDLKAEVSRALYDLTPLSYVEKAERALEDFPLLYAQPLNVVQSTLKDYYTDWSTPEIVNISLAISGAAPKERKTGKNGWRVEMSRRSGGGGGPARTSSKNSQQVTINQA